EARRFLGAEHVDGFVVLETERLQIGDVRPEVLRWDEQEVALFETEFRVADLSLQHVGTNSAFVDIEQGDVVVGDLVEQDDELYEVGVGLLPEGFFASSKQVVDEGGDAVGERIGVEAVVEGVVVVVGIEADFDVVRVASEARKDRTHFFAEIALDLKYETTNAFFRVRRFVGEDLFRIGIEGRTGLAAAYGTEDSDSGEQAPFWDREPVGCCRWLRRSRVVDLAEHEEQIVTIGRGWIGGRLARFWPRRRLQGEDV